MMRTTKAKVIGLVLAGAVVLSGGVYATTALAAGGSSPETALTQQTASTTAEWRAGMLEMLQDHMGLNGQAAEEFADEMTQHMQGFDKDFDFQEMIDQCDRYSEGGEYGPGMMNGYGMMDDGTYGPGMMDEGTYGPGMMGDDSAYGSYGMMGGMMDGNYSLDEGWHMMDTAPLPESGSTGQASTTPMTPEPQQNGYEPGNESARGEMMNTATTGSGSTPQEPDMMEAAPSLDTTPTTSTPATPTPTAPATQSGGYGSYPGGMMGSGMMGR